MACLLEVRTGCFEYESASDNKDATEEDIVDKGHIITSEEGWTLRKIPPTIFPAPRKIAQGMVRSTLRHGTDSAGNTIYSFKPGWCKREVGGGSDLRLLARMKRDKVSKMYAEGL